jgi:hypothetical protein
MVTIMNALTDTDTDLLYSQAAAALGMTQGAFSTFLKRKGFAGRRSPNHRYAKVISRTELERLIGYPLTDAQITAAKSVTHARKKFTQDDVARLMRQTIERRDEDWKVWIVDSSERALHPHGPPMIGTDDFSSALTPRKALIVMEE